MILIFVIIGLLIAIIVLSIQYFITYAKLTSHKSFDREAKKAAKGFVYEDPNITCDYCGARINVLKDTICPACGAPYSADQEWKDRFKVNQPEVDEKAEEEADREISLAQQKAKQIAKRLRKYIFILLGILAAFVILAIVLHFNGGGESYAKTEEVNKYSFEHFEKTDSSFEDNLLLDQCGITIHVSAVYKDADRDYYKLEYHIQSKAEDNMRVRFRLYSVNHLGGCLYDSFFYENIKKGSDIYLYDEISAEGIDQIESLDYGYFSINDSEYETDYESAQILTLVTPENKNTTPPAPSDKILFENDKLVVYYLEPSENHPEYFNFAVFNKSEDAVTLEAKFRQNGQDADFIFDNDVLITPGTLFYFKDLHYYGEGEASKSPEVTLSIASQDHPENDFSTGYFKMNYEETE